MAPGVEPQTVVFAAVYDIKANTTTVPDRRDAMPMSVTDPVYLITTMLKRFADYNPNMSKFTVNILCILQLKKYLFYIRYNYHFVAMLVVLVLNYLF